MVLSLDWEHKSIVRIWNSPRKLVSKLKVAWFLLMNLQKVIVGFLMEESKIVESEGNVQKKV